MSERARPFATLEEASVFATTLCGPIPRPPSAVPAAALSARTLAAETRQKTTSDLQNQTLSSTSISHKHITRSTQRPVQARAHVAPDSYHMSIAFARETRAFWAHPARLLH